MFQFPGDTMPMHQEVIGKREWILTMNLRDRTLCALLGRGMRVIGVIITGGRHSGSKEF